MRFVLDQLCIFCAHRFLDAQLGDKKALDSLIEKHAGVPNTSQPPKTNGVNGHSNVNESNGVH